MSTVRWYGHTLIRFRLMARLSGFWLVVLLATNGWTQPPSAEPARGSTDRSGERPRWWTDNAPPPSLFQPAASTGGGGSQDYGPVPDPATSGYRVDQEAWRTPVDTLTLNERRLRELWRNARRALWYGQHAQAERYYLALLEYLPQDPDVVGELGNFYTLLGDYDRAGQAYAEAVRRLVRQGRGWEAGQLVQTVRADGVVPPEPVLAALQQAYRAILQDTDNAEMNAGMAIQDGARNTTLHDNKLHDNK